MTHNNVDTDARKIPSHIDDFFINTETYFLNIDVAVMSKVS